MPDKKPDQMGEVISVLESLHHDGHQWSRRPCATCQGITDRLGVRFGCIRYAYDKARASSSGETGEREG